ncbi:MAG TPA: protein kinase, partial [Gemmatimonadales bacterium]|nr:protein kinase [Gemmatimonadales bacterium]
MSRLRVPALLPLLLAACPAPAPPLESRELAPPADTVIAPFAGEVTDAAWLEGDRWVVISPQDRAVQVVDFRTHALTPFPTRARQELEQPFHLFRSGDTIFVADWQRRRLTGWSLRGAPAGVLQVAGALAVLHARGIVHRDVNAGNVIVERGVETRATLVDLGMAELSEKFYAVAELRYPTPPERRVSLGTGGLERLAWTAPEARAGAGWTGKSDVFSLGVLLFRVLTGKVPFVEEVARARSVREWLPRCPETLAGAIAWALEVEPERRCDARELVEALEDAAVEVEAIERGAAGEP